MQFAFSIDSLFDLVQFFLGFGLLAIGTVVQRNGADSGRDAEQDLDAPLPRARRRRHRSKTDRGLPPDEEIEKLAVAYLERQRKHWPDVAKAGLLPTGAANEIRDMVDDFSAEAAVLGVQVCHAIVEAARAYGGDEYRELGRQIRRQVAAAVMPVAEQGEELVYLRMHVCSLIFFKGIRLLKNT